MIEIIRITLFNVSAACENKKQNVVIVNSKYAVIYLLFNTS